MERNASKDGLLDDWGISHLHLGRRLKGKFIRRSKFVLLTFFTDSDAYLLGVFDHGHWADVELLEILHANWPKAIAHARTGLKPSFSGSPTAQEITRAREAGVAALITLADGTVYAPPNWGYSTARVAISVVEQDNKLLGRLHELQVAASPPPMVRHDQSDSTRVKATNKVREATDRIEAGDSSARSLGVNASIGSVYRPPAVTG
jgi:hypothetical protein